MRVALVGPTYPFRGGIAHYTTLLATEIQKNNELLLCSFKRQYPRWLYPGKFEHEIGGALGENNAYFLLDSLDPVTWLRTARTILNWNADVLVLQWWVPFWAPAWLLITHYLRKKSSLPIVFICHNVLPHEERFVDKIIARQVLSLATGVVVHAQSEAMKLKKLLPHKHFEINPHPSYGVFQHNSMSLEEARKILDIPLQSNVILFFGFIRRYKGVDILLDAIGKINMPVETLIVGEIWGNDNENLLARMQKLSLEGKVQLIDHYVPNEEVAKYFSAADVIVLPYRHASQSGVIQIAYSFNVPVIASRVDGLVDAVQHGKTGFLVPPDDPDSLAETLEHFFSLGLTERKEIRDNIESNMDRYSWSRMVQTIKRAANL